MSKCGVFIPIKSFPILQHHKPLIEFSNLMTILVFPISMWQLWNLESFIFNCWPTQRCSSDVRLLEETNQNSTILNPIMHSILRLIVYHTSLVEYGIYKANLSWTIANSVYIEGIKVSLKKLTSTREIQAMFISFQWWLFHQLYLHTYFHCLNMGTLYLHRQHPCLCCF
jgi:hypothetical protein